MSVGWHVTSHGILKDMEEPDPITQPRLAAYIVETDGEDLDIEARDHIEDTFRMRCYCSHDCCGHRTGGRDLHLTSVGGSLRRARINITELLREVT